MLARHEQLVKEMEGQKQHGNYHQLQIENLKRELADALVSFVYHVMIIIIQCHLHIEGWLVC